MNATEIKKLINSSGKRGNVKYKGKDERTKFDESGNLKKSRLISDFIGNQIDKVAEILSK
ncbi:hypothetical protein [Chryseobacterium arthrosphaerae]|nr:hypothetical protein [Chryseobacterium arthrosphaerae]